MKNGAKMKNDFNIFNIGDKVTLTEDSSGKVYRVYRVNRVSCHVIEGAIFKIYNVEGLDTEFTCFGLRHVKDERYCVTIPSCRFFSSKEEAIDYAKQHFNDFNVFKVTEMKNIKKEINWVETDV